MDFLALRSLFKQRVRLFFNDGEVVDAVLGVVDPEHDRDFTYEVQRIVHEGKPRPLGTGVGATCVASLDHLERWEALE